MRMCGMPSKSHDANSPIQAKLLGMNHMSHASHATSCTAPVPPVCTCMFVCVCVCAGDAVAVMLPMTPAAAAIYLGIVLSGCCAVSIADSFAAHEVETRLAISKARLIITQVRVGELCSTYDHVCPNHKPKKLEPENPKP